jgi:uncharacterized protein (DUF1501 family)
MPQLLTTLFRTLPELRVAPQAQEPANVLVVVFLRGAMDGLNAVIPYTDDNYYKLRPTIAIAKPKAGDDKTAIDLDGAFGLHPALRPLKDAWDARNLALVHASGSQDPTHSHFEAWDNMESGTPGEKRQSSGWLARHLQTALAANASPLRAVGFGTSLPLVLRGQAPAVAVRSVDEFRLGGKNAPKEIKTYQGFLTELYTSAPDFNATAALTFRAADTLEKLAGSAYAPANGAQYPTGTFGQNLQQTAQLIKANLGLEAGVVSLGGWDTHAGQGGAEGRMATLLKELAQGLAAFQKDLQNEAKRLTVVVMSEFGRRAAENGSGGTDHGHGNVMLVLGGGVKGGKVYGAFPGLSADKLYGPGDLAVTTDFRDVLAEISQKRLPGVKPELLFPGFNPKPLGMF